MESSIYCRHCGKKEEENPRSGVKVATRGPRMIIATTTEQGTEEDTETTSRVTRSMFDNFMRRPSIEDQAIRTIASMANNDLSMMNPENDDAVLCDAAFVFLDRNKARFLISGKSAAWHFEDGKLKNRSSRDAAPQIGSGRYYEPHLEPVFELKQGKNAILAASQTLEARWSEAELKHTATAPLTLSGNIKCRYM